MKDQWENISRIALLGLNNANPTEWSMPESTDSKTAVELFLNECVKVFYQNKVGRVPLKISPSSSYRKPENESVISSRSAYFFEQILSGPYEGAIQEFIELCKAQQKVLKPYLIPLVLNHSFVDTFWEDIKQISGSILYWLIEQNEAWERFDPKLDHTLWNSDDFNDKLAFLKTVRQKTPSSVIELIESMWTDLPIPEKKKLLTILKINPTLDDESFLIKAAKDNSKAVRNIANELLLKIPQSQLSHQLAEEIRKIVLVKDNSLLIDLPNTFSDSWEVFTIKKKSKTKPDGLGWLLQMLEIAYPSNWMDEHHLSSVDWVKSLDRTDYRHLIIPVLMKSAMKHEDKKALDALIDRWSTTPEQKHWYPLSGLLKQVSTDLFNKIILRNLQTNPTLIEESDFIYKLILSANVNWSDDVTFSIIKPFQRWIIETRRMGGWYYEHYNNILQKGAYHINPSLFEQLTNGWYFQSPMAYQWQEEIDQFQNILKFRRAMRKSLT